MFGSDKIKGKFGKDESSGKGPKRGFAALLVALGGFAIWRNRNKKKNVGNDYDAPEPGTRSAAGE